MGYDDAKSYESATTIRHFPGLAEKAVAIHPEPESPRALGEMARAASEYAKAAETFITARHALNDAKDEWQRCQQLVAGLADKEGI